MSAASLFRYVYLARFSQPAAERLLYRAIRRHKVRKFVELGVGTCQRASRLISVAQRYAAGEPIHYTGIDLFEARDGDGPQLALKAAYQVLRPTGARVQPVPGDPRGALSRSANALAGTELVIVSLSLDRASLERAWFYVPRMLAKGALVYIEELAADNTTALRLMSRGEIDRMAAAVSSPARAA